MSTTRHPMSSADAAWLHMDRRTNLMIVNAVLWFDEPLDWPAVQRLFMERVVASFPRFRRRIDEGLPGRAPAWCDDERFEPELHFHCVALPAPGDRAALQTVLSDLVSAPLDRGRPLWDAYLLEGYGPGCAVLVRMHHAIADGIALARVMLSLTDVPGAADAFEPPDAPAPSRGRTLAALTGPAGAALAAGRLAVRGGAGIVRRPGRLREHAGTLGLDGRALAKFLLPGGDPQSALKRDLAVAHRVAWSEPVSLRTVKRAGRALDATVNDVLVAAVAGAVREHLLATGDPVRGMHALVPFNLRPLDEPLPRDLGNRFGLLLLGLPVGVEDPIGRVRAVHEEMQAIKASHEGALAYGLIGLIGHTPPAVEARLVDYFAGKGTMVLTNVPGPRETVELTGTPVRGVLVWAPCSGGVGMSVSVFSYDGQVTVGFLTDAAVLDDPQPLADGFRAEVRRIARAAREQAARS